MKRNILLIEPNYKNKYPPIGLMKIAAYHRQLGDNVVFFKGDLRAFVLEQIYLECLDRLQYIENSVYWLEHQNFIKDFIKKKDLSLFDNINFIESNNKPLLDDCLNYYRNYYIKGRYKTDPKWDRVYITTLFTFYWKITIETINFAKIFVKDLKELKVGGIMATLLPNDIKKVTGIEPIQGLLDKSHILDSDNDLIIDEMYLDYSILDEVDYKYDTKNSYITFMTKGCVRKCAFCAVPKLEPIYKSKVPTITKYNKIKELYGEQQNLLLMDNNVLASKRFPEIIQEIKEMGFYKGAIFIEPNQLEIAIRNLKNGINDKAYMRRSYNLIHELLKRLRGKIAQNYYSVLEKFNLLKFETVTKENLLKAYTQIDNIYESHRNQQPKLKHVDFNQGVDCRYITDEYMQLMSEIPIQPLRIAFDSLEIEKEYRKAIGLAAKYGIKELSAYLFYNYQDSPDEFYRRLEINMELCRELDVTIYSFPMKYIPLYGEDAKHREYMGPKWNKKFIRAIQSIINVTKGIVAPPSRNGKSSSFFTKAFGKDLHEFHELLYMPETYIIYRKLFEKELGYTYQWQDLFNSLTEDERAEVIPIIESNTFKDVHLNNQNDKISKLLQHYKITRDDVKKANNEHNVIKNKFNSNIG